MSTDGTAPPLPTTTNGDVWRIAAPMLLSNLSIPLLGLVDTAVLGHLDQPWYLAAVGVGAMIFTTLYNGVNFLRMGTTGIAAQGFGRSDGDTVVRSLREATLVALAVATLMLLAHPWIRDAALAIMRPEDIVRTEAARYFDIRIWSAPATLATSVIVGWFLGLSNARVPLTITLVVNLTNIVLDIVLVVGFGMKTAGVAYATLVAEYLGLTVGVFLVLRESGRWPSTLTWRQCIREADLVRYFAVNGNIFVRTMALMFTLFTMTALSARLGTAVLAANTILLNLLHVISYGLDALAHAAEAIVGKFEGRRDRAGLKHSVGLIFRWSFGIAVGMTLALWIGGPALVRLLTDIDSVVATAGVYLPWLVIMPLVTVWSFVYDGVFIGATLAREMRNVMCAAAFFVFVPVWWVAQPLGNHGLWLAFTAFMLTRAVGMHIYYRRRYRTPLSATV
ncbi:MAG: MATE family efflux transporter [Pseudomonadota bacterium]